MGMASGSGTGTRSAINVTPLIDVLLVLLIILMVIQPNAVRGLEALAPQPPKSRQQEEVNPKTIVVQVLPDGKGGTAYRINEDAVQLADLESRLSEIFEARNDRVMFVKGAKDLDFGSVIPVIDGGHRAGVANIGILTPGVERVP